MTLNVLIWLYQIVAILFEYVRISFKSFSNIRLVENTYLYMLIKFSQKIEQVPIICKGHVAMYLIRTFTENKLSTSPEEVQTSSRNWGITTKRTSSGKLRYL